MGGVISSIFGGGQSYEVPEYPESEPITIQEESKEPVSKAAREEEQRKIKARRVGASGTILTSPLGTSGSSLLNSKLGG